MRVPSRGSGSPSLDFAALARRGVRPARALAARGTGGDTPRWHLDEVTGRLVELSGAGAGAWLTAAMSLVAGTQRRGEPVAWVTLRGSFFFPPDAARHGVDLAALPVILAPGAAAAGAAAERLLRSGAFGLVVLDLVPAGDDLPAPLVPRLAALAERHGTAVLCLTAKPAAAPSLGPLVSLRCEARREGLGPGPVPCRVTALRDRRRGRPWTHVEAFRGPAGLH